jgi:hypothetical protein
MGERLRNDRELMSTEAVLRCVDDEDYLVHGHRFERE